MVRHIERSWRAGRIYRLANSFTLSGDRLMTVAFVLQTYKALDQIELLARTLAQGTQDRFVVVCHRGSKGDRDRLTDAEGVDHVVPSPGGRSRFGMLDGLISAMRWLEAQPKGYDWLVVMSGQDYPIRPLAELEAELQSSSYDGYFPHFDAMNEAEASAPPWQWSRDLVDERYHFNYALLKENVSTFERALLKVPRHLLQWTSRNFRIHTSFALMLGCRPAETPFSPEFKLYGGNYWMTINRKAVRTILAFVDARPDIVHYFRGVISPEEGFLPTILANDSRLRLSRKDLRYTDFARSRHGVFKELRMEDLAQAFASGCYIARKFDFQRDPAVLEALNEAIGRPAVQYPLSAKVSATPVANQVRVRRGALLSQAC